MLGVLASLAALTFLPVDLGILIEPGIGIIVLQILFQNRGRIRRSSAAALHTRIRRCLVIELQEAVHIDRAVRVAGKAGEIQADEHIGSDLLAGRVDGSTAGPVVVGLTLILALILRTLRAQLLAGVHIRTENGIRRIAEGNQSGCKIVRISAGNIGVEGHIVRAIVVADAVVDLDVRAGVGVDALGLVIESVAILQNMERALV